MIGSDSPQLPVTLVQTAFATLQSYDSVLGPSRDGGYYLLGLRGAIRDLFTGVEMSTSHVAEQTIAKAELAGCSIAVLPRLFDVDEVGELQLLYDALRQAPSPEADPAPQTLAIMKKLFEPQHR